VSRTGRAWLLLAGAVGVIVVAALVAGRSDGGAHSAEDRVHEIAAELRCPVCQNLSVADSPSRLAGEMRAEIAVKLEAGETPEEIRAFFVDRYGEWVLLAPTKRGLNLLPWAVPVIGVLAGAAVWVALVRRRGGESRAAAPDAPIGERP
jgi:cytochrome c-type biogenesis protein CcmH